MKKVISIVMIIMVVMMGSIAAVAEEDYDWETVNRAWELYSEWTSLNPEYEVYNSCILIDDEGYLLVSGVMSRKDFLRRSGKLFNIKNWMEYEEEHFNVRVTMANDGMPVGEIDGYPIYLASGIQTNDDGTVYKSRALFIVVE